MVVPASYEFTREMPRHGTPADRFALQPFATPTDVLALLGLVGELQTRVNELEGQRRQISAAFHRLDAQVRSAAEIQRAMLPPPVAMTGLEIRTLYRPLESLGGDLYDFARCDDTHLAICLADACGHGLPAALIGAFLKHAFRGMENTPAATRLLEPGDVLRNVNRDLLDCNLEEGRFATGIDAVYSATDRTLKFARGGMPYPILLRPGQRPRQLVSAGPLIGALAAADFEAMTVALEPGDCVLFYTDGLEALLCEHGRRGTYGNIADTPWFEELSAHSVEAILADVSDRLDHVRDEDWPADDVSIIALRAL